MASSASASARVSASSVSVLDWTPEKSTVFKLIRLIINGGTTALRNVLKNCHPGKFIKAILAPEKKNLGRFRGCLYERRDGTFTGTGYF